MDLKEIFVNITLDGEVWLDMQNLYTILDYNKQQSDKNHSMQGD